MFGRNLQSGFWENGSLVAWNNATDNKTLGRQVATSLRQIRNASNEADEAYVIGWTQRPDVSFLLGVCNRRVIMDMKVFEAYSLKARYYPTVIVIAPLCLVILSIASDKWDLLKSIGAVVVSTLGLAFVMEQVGRDQGKKKETSLFQVWGGKPTTRILRHRDPTLDRTTRERYHSKLARLVEGIQMPTAQQEEEDPNAADSIYDSCAAFLRAQTRDPKEFPLVFQENMNYGFRRNLWGMKPAGIVNSVIGALACSTLAIRFFCANKEEWLVAATCSVICTVLLVLWVCRFTPSWVKVTADEYARQLVSACDSLKTHEQGGAK